MKSGPSGESLLFAPFRLDVVNEQPWLAERELKLGDVRLTANPLWGLHQLLQSRDRCEELALSKLARDDVAGYLAGQFPGHQLPDELASELEQS